MTQNQTEISRVRNLERIQMGGFEIEPCTSPLIQLNSRTVTLFTSVRCAWATMAARHSSDDTGRSARSSILQAMKSTGTTTYLSSRSTVDGSGRGAEISAC